MKRKLILAVLVALIVSLTTSVCFAAGATLKNSAPKKISKTKASVTETARWSKVSGATKYKVYRREIKSTGINPKTKKPYKTYTGKWAHVKTTTATSVKKGRTIKVLGPNDWPAMGGLKVEVQYSVVPVKKNGKNMSRILTNKVARIDYYNVKNSQHRLEK